MKLLLLACLLGLLPAWSHCQTLCNMAQTQSCHTNCQSCYAECDGAQGLRRCCVLDLPNNPSAEDYPLGYQLRSLPGTDDDDPDPCFRVQYTEDEVNSTNNINYLILAVETANSRLCLQTNMNNGATCGTNGFYYCNSVPVTMAERNVDVRVFCDNSCEVTPSDFEIKVVKITLQNDDEDLCENMANPGVIPFPSSLNAVTDATQAERDDITTAHAHPLVISQAAIFLTLIVSLLKVLF